MFDYRAELERRIDQFAGYLGRMHGRAHKAARSSCFMVFKECPPEGDREPVLVEKRALALQAVQSAFDDLGLPDEPGDSDGFGLPDEGWRGDDSLDRFVQFSFERKWFCMDMPRQTLFRPEAEEILRRRRGFFYLADREEFTLHEEDVDGFDPFRKIYLYGDERSAAEDMAFIFFQLWKFPVESRLYVTSASFNSKFHWEQGTPIE